MGVLFVTWKEHHVVSSEEHELIGVLSGFGAAAIRSIGLYRELDDAYLSTVSALTATIQARDHYREDHQRRVAADALALGERVRLRPEEMRDLRYASLFHSLGKIGIPASILGKNGPLTPEEITIVREHPLLGARILESIRFLKGVVPIVRHANERWDGTGYPDGLTGEAIRAPRGSSTWSSGITPCSPTGRTASHFGRTSRSESCGASRARGTTRRWWISSSR